MLCVTARSTSLVLITKWQYSEAMQTFTHLSQPWKNTSKLKVFRFFAGFVPWPFSQQYYLKTQTTSHVLGPFLAVSNQPPSPLGHLAVGTHVIWLLLSTGWVYLVFYLHPIIDIQQRTCKAVCAAPGRFLAEICWHCSSVTSNCSEAGPRKWHPR